MTIKNAAPAIHPDACCLRLSETFTFHALERAGHLGSHMLARSKMATYQKGSPESRGSTRMCLPAPAWPGATNSYQKASRAETIKNLHRSLRTAASMTQRHSTPRHEHGRTPRRRSPKHVPIKKHHLDVFGPSGKPRDGAPSAGLSQTRTVGEQGRHARGAHAWTSGLTAASKRLASGSRQNRPGDAYRAHKRPGDPTAQRMRQRTLIGHAGCSWYTIRVAAH